MCRKLTFLVSFILVLGLATSITKGADPSLVGWWKFDEGSGTTVTDSSGNGNNGTLVGGVTWVAGRFGSAVQLDGTSGYISIPGFTLTTDSITFVAWLNGWKASDWAPLISSRAVNACEMNFGANDTLHYTWNNNSGDTYNWTGGPVIPQDSWAMLAMTIDAGSATAYVYTDAGGLAQGTNALAHVEQTVGALQIGWSFDSRYIRGIIDEAQIYSRALSQDEISALVTGIQGYPYAFGPDPEDGALLTNFPGGILGKSLSWKAGDYAVSHDVYFGEDFDQVNNGTGGTFRGNQSTTFFLAGYGYTPNDPVPGGFVPGTTYYWRIDEVNDLDPNSPWKGPVWSFSLPSTTAYQPTPTDGSTFVDPNADLSWELGFGGVMQTIYFGVDYDTISNATTGGISIGTLNAYDPGSLEYDTTYYWRVDTTGIYGELKGDVWSFKTTLPGLGMIVLERWNDFTGSVTDLKNFYKFPNNPDEVETLSQFSWDLVDLDNYGARIYGWVYAPATGDYTFWLATDDNGELWLSTDDDPSNVELIAQESTWQNPNTWGTGEEQSDPIPLVGGNRYYIEALWQEGGGGDHCMVAWRGPAIPTTTVIAGNYLSPYRPFKAYGAKPTNGATGVTQMPVLEWKPGIQTASHEVYFGTDEDAVTNATKASLEYVGPFALGSESYDPGKLDWESTYYWRVDEINNLNPESPWKGTTWSFTTADYAIVDDFEDYNNSDKQIWAIWHDGLGYWDLQGTFHPGNGTGAAVGDEDNDATYMEETIVNSGDMSMPYFYTNNDPSKMKYSEAKMTLINPRDWTEGGVRSLSLWFQGYPASSGSFTDNLDGTYTMTVLGADITGQSDEFHYAYKVLNGAGSITARIDSVRNTNGWAKAGVMIRDTLDPNSAHAMVFVTPGNGVNFEYRPDTGADNTGAGQQTGITAPHWVRLERDISGFVTAFYSSNGSTWESLGVPEPVTMNIPLYIGLALSGNNVNQICQAVFSNVQVSVSGPWVNQDIGILSNEPERIYVSIANSNGTTGTVYYQDNDNIVEDATQIDTWTEFNIDMKDFQDQGVNLADVNSIAVGIGTRGSTTAGGTGKMYIDDIRLYKPRCVPDIIKPVGDFSNNCIVDYLDLEIMSNNWLMNDYDVTPAAPSDTSLVAYYELENNLLDSSGNGYHGDPCGAPSYVPGQVGTALEFDGDDSVDTGYTEDLPNWTVSAWVISPAAPSGDAPSGPVHREQNFQLNWNHGDTTFRGAAALSVGGVWYAASYSPLEANTWYHLAATYDGEVLNAYRDGFLITSNSTPSGPPTSESNSLKLGRHAASTQYFTGTVDEVRIYSSALSQAEIGNLAGKTTTYTQDLYLLLTPPDPAINMNGDSTIDLKDYAVLADIWLEEQLWPEE